MKASVVLSARNERQRLARSLPSLVAQAEPAARVLVLDLASADGTQDWLRVRWPEVDHLRLPRPDTAPVAALDAALERIDTEAVAFMAPGEVWPRDVLRRAAAALAADPGTAALSFKHRPASLLSGLCCRTDRLRGPACGEATLGAEVLARLGAPPQPLRGVAPVLPAAPPSPPMGMEPERWRDALAACADFRAGGTVLLVGLDAADRPAGLLDLLGHAVALAGRGWTVEAFTLADLEWRRLEGALAGAPLLVTATGGFGPGEAALQLCFEELLRRAGPRPVRLALRRLAPSSLVLAGRLIEAVRGHPDAAIWVADRVSRAYGASLLGHRVRLAPPGIAGLAAILRAFRGRYAGLLPPLPAPGAETDPAARLHDLDSWHAGLDRAVTERLGLVLARLAGTASILRTPALQAAWSLILPGWAALASPEAPLATRSLDIALFAGLSGRVCDLAPVETGTPELFATWAHLLEPAGLRLAAA